MDPAIVAVLMVIASAVATAITRFSAYYWPTGYHRRRDSEKNTAPETPAVLVNAGE